LSVDALAVCKTLAGEFRQLNLQDAWKDDVLQLNAQLYYAFVSLQRPLEDTRSLFETLGTSHVVMEQSSGTHRDPSEAGATNAVAVRARKRKHREDRDGEQNPKRRFQCGHCNNEKRSFFDHGFRGHL
jgi:hypothetical protein